MIIDKIRYVDRKGWFVFEGEKGKSLCISYETYLKLDLHQGSSIEGELLEHLEKEDRKNRALDTGKTYALAQPRTQSQVRERLKREGIDEDLIWETLDFLNEKGYVDDLSYGKKYAREKAFYGHWSKRKISLKLQEKGLSVSFIKRALEEIPENLEKENLEDTLDKKYGKRKLTDPREFQRVYQALIRRGFSYEMILPLLKEKAKKEED